MTVSMDVPQNVHSGESTMLKLQGTTDCDTVTVENFVPFYYLNFRAETQNASSGN